MHIRAAGLDTDFAQHCDRAIAHDLIFFVGQRQRRGHSDRIARMHPHRINVFNRTDDNCVIRRVAHNLHFKFFPTQKGFVDQDLAHRAGIKSRLAKVFVIFAIERHTTAGAPQRKCRADNGWQSDMLQRVEAFLHCIGNHRFGVFQTQPIHRLAKQLSVFRHFNCRTLGTDHLNTKLIQHTHLFQRQRRVQPRLPAHGGQQRVGSFFFNDLCHHFGRDGLDICGIRQSGVCHDGGRVRVHQNDPIPLFAQRFAGLRPGIIKLAGLSNDDGPGADNHD